MHPDGTHPRSPSADLDYYPTATLHEAAGRIGALPSRLRPAYSGAKLAGPAYPVLCPVGDNLWLHRAVAAAGAGDVLVVQTTANDEFGYWGEILSEAAHARDLGGLVIDGGVRDIAALERVGFPVFATQTCIRGTGKNPAGPGRLGAPIRLGEIRIAAGDLIVGDYDGVVAIPKDSVPQVLAASRDREQAESRLIEKIRAGASTLDLFSLPR